MTSVPPTILYTNYRLAAGYECYGFVLRTGFATTQGKIVRSMMFTSERVTANNAESFLFILFLLVFAIAAAGYVLVEGTTLKRTTDHAVGSRDQGRSRYKLLLECVLIITAVVPPELPMELSLAVNNSLMALSRFAIFVMEPFRIPLAGKVDVCCFDKTGTLTGENLAVEGLLLPDDLSSLKTAVDEVPIDTAICTATCHSLFRIKESIAGDPMEKAMLDFAGWTVQDGDAVVDRESKASATILHRFPFLSSLRRMSVVASLPGKRSIVTVKGAPEVIKELLTRCPEGYDQAYQNYANSGARVLALAHKALHQSLGHETAKHLKREEVESKLSFAGFIVFRCPMKPDSKKAIRSLMRSGHRVIMITGDNALTAIHTAVTLELTTPDVCLVDAVGGKLVYVDPVAQSDVQLDSERHRNSPLAITGDALDLLTKSDPQMLFDRITVFARASPSQKEEILAAYKKRGLVTLMCGDGTNDVGALKQAHIGVALLDGKPEDLDKILKGMREQALAKQKAEMEASAKAWRDGLNAARARAGQAPVEEETTAALQQLSQAFNQEQEGPTFRLGDASVAAPFSSRISTIESVCNIVRQGRCTLVTTIQMYKILAVNSLISAYSLSVLHLQGIRYGDFQVTITGLLLASCFMFLTKAQPIKKLSTDRPQSNIFNPYLLLSVVGQFALHVGTLYFVVTTAKRFMYSLPHTYFVLTHYSQICKEH